MNLAFDRKKTSIFGLFVSAIALVSCGVSTGSTAITAGTSTINAISADLIQEATDSIADDSSTSATALTTESVVSPQTATLTRTCTGGGSAGAAATVTMKLAGSNTVTLTRPKFSVSSDLTETGTLSRVWTPPAGGTIQCNLAATRVRFDWTQDTIVNGLSVAQTFDRARNATRTVTVTASGTQSTKTNNFTATGTRTVTWSTGTGTASGKVTRTKSIASTATRTAKITSADNVDTTLELTTATKTAEPLTVTVVRSATAPYALESKTVKSGTVVATRTGKDRTESTFANVVYDMTSATPCLPTSGTVTVKYFATDSATDATSTSTITFGSTTDSGVSITPTGGNETDFIEYNAKGCDLEKEI